jgi:hypothetical protein
MAASIQTRNTIFGIGSPEVIPSYPDYYTPVSLTGTLDSDGVYVKGSGTAFLTEIADVDANGNQRATDLGYIWDGGNGVVKVVGVIDDETLVLKNEPLSPFSTSSCTWHRSPKMKEITVLSESGSSSSTLNGIPIPAGASVTFRQDYNGQLLEPMIGQDVIYTIRW